MTVYGEIEFIIRISPFQERHFSQFTLNIEAAGSPETPVHIIAYQMVNQSLGLFKDVFRPSRVTCKKKQIT
jgi:hypothetical protein